jgi:hypothetical protein
MWPCVCAVCPVKSGRPHDQDSCGEYSRPPDAVFQCPDGETVSNLPAL